ncbi:hypothetical protein ANN_26866 [Periplaneta americana]|uniref:Uncharacterized protein n=1 Tax=Periplaneta americana TaxID=6978 RepID=A0ABQ8RZH6_PERAM|nr:hypothetical protein ANN_26866 [Periplaneta americana]
MFLIVSAWVKSTVQCAAFVQECNSSATNIIHKTEVASTGREMIIAARNFFEKENENIRQTNTPLIPFTQIRTAAALVLHDVSITRKEVYLAVAPVVSDNNVNRKYLIVSINVEHGGSLPPSYKPVTGPYPEQGTVRVVIVVIVAPRWAPFEGEVVVIEVPRWGPFEGGNAVNFLESSSSGICQYELVKSKLVNIEQSLIRPNKVSTDSVLKLSLTEKELTCRASIVTLKLPLGFLTQHNAFT